MKAYLKTFVIGGGLCAVAQLILEIIVKLGVEYGLAITIMLAVKALLGTVLTVIGVYPKLEEHGQMGAMLPFTGFSAAITAFTNLALGAGENKAKACFKGLSAALIIFGVGLPFALLAAFIGTLV